MTTLTDLPPTISVEEAGKILGLSRTSAYRAASRGDLPTIRINGRLYVPTARLLALLGCGTDTQAPLAG
jgi:excisionase family DNA binding protein